MKRNSFLISACLMLTVLMAFGVGTAFSAGQDSSGGMEGGSQSGMDQQQSSQPHKGRMQQPESMQRQGSMQGQQQASVMSKQDAAKAVDASAKVFQDVAKNEKKSIPPQVMKDAAGVVIIPGMMKSKAGAAEGSQQKNGVLVAKSDDKWSLPVFVSASGGSLSAQSGAQAANMVLVFNDKDQVQKITEGGSFTLGTDASVASGPIGQNAKPAEKSDVLAYKQSGGAFSGVSLTGTILSLNQEPTMAYYNINEESKRGYYGKEEKLVQNIIEKGEEMKNDKQQQMIQEVPQGAKNLRQSLENFSQREQQEQKR